MFALDPSPQARGKATKEEALSRQQVAREIGLEEADGGPGSREGAGGKGCHARRARQYALQAANGVVVEAAEARDDGHGGVEENKEAGHGRERLEPKGKICARARRIAWMKSGAGERCDERVRLGGKRRNGRNRGWEDVLLVRKHGW